MQTSRPEKRNTPSSSSRLISRDMVSRCTPIRSARSERVIGSCIRISAPMRAPCRAISQPSNCSSRSLFEVVAAAMIRAWLRSISATARTISRSMIAGLLRRSFSALPRATVQTRAGIKARASVWCSPWLRKERKPTISPG